MRYVVIFFDRTTKRVTAETALVFMRAQKTGEPVFYKGNTYSGKTIASIRTILGFFQDKLAEAREAGKYFCKYGYLHEFRGDCGCRDANFEPMLTREELVLLPVWSEKMELEQSKLLLPSKL